MIDMKKNILVIVWHPRWWSFCEALADSYIQWAKESWYVTKQIYLSQHTEVNFNLIEWENTGKGEDPIRSERREHLTWADHILFVFPTRRYSAPACLKWWFDKMLIPKFSHQYTWFLKRKKLLTWRTASMVSTCGGPWYTYLATLWHPWIRRLKRTLWFVGITPKRNKLFTKIAPDQRTDIELERMVVKMKKYGNKAW